MKPTLEEVKKVCEQCGMFPPSNFTALQAFAQHYIMVGREIESNLMVEAAIRNNTGE